MSHDYDDLPELVLSPIAMPDDEIVIRNVCVCAQAGLPPPFCCLCVCCIQFFSHIKRYGSASHAS